MSGVWTFARAPKAKSFKTGSNAIGCLAGEDFRAFEILNLGRYERQHFVGVNPNLREEEPAQQLAAKEAAFLELILRAYRAEKVEPFAHFHGKRAGEPAGDALVCGRDHPGMPQEATDQGGYPRLRV